MHPPVRRSPSANGSDYRAVFIARVHQLLQIGYSRMNPAEFATTKEPDISGEIRRHIREFLDKEPLQPWMRFFTPLNEDPVDEAPNPAIPFRRTGEGRRLLDLHFECSERHPRLRFLFEAKRLNSSGSVAAYIGPEGLGRIIDGHYARNDFAAGMLGYVQTKTPGEWAAKISVRIESSAHALPLASGCKWQPRPFRRGPSHTFASKHRRPAVGDDVDIYHTFLLLK